MRRTLRTAAVLAAAMTTLAACGGGSGGSTTPAPTGTGGTTSAPAKDGGILRIGYTSDIDSINPFVGFSSTAYVVFTEVYPTLVHYDENYKIVGDWATSWETSPDGLIWTFHLKPGGKWSDGTPLTAKDAAFTGNLIIKYADTATGTLAPFLSHATKVDAPDDNTVVITYDKAVANVLPQLQQFFVLPQHIWEAHVGVNGKDLKKWKPDVPAVGAGAFFIKAYEKKGTTILERNPGYYNPRPHVDAVGITLYENSDAMLAAFEKGDLDAVDSVPFTVADKFKKDPRFQVQQGDSTLIYDFGFNSNPAKTKHKELLDLKVREAFSHAVNRDEIVKTVFNGYAKPAVSLLSPINGDFLNTDLKPEAYDLALANQQLDTLGYKKGADGIRTVPGGGAMSYEVITPQSVEGIDRQFEIVKTSYQQIGVQLNQKKLDGTAAFNAIMAPDGKYTEFDMHMWDWVGYIDPDFVLSVMQCNQWGNWSDTGFCNKEYDQLYKDQGVATDPAKRKEIIWKMQQILYDEKPYVQIAQVDAIRAYAKGWTGLTPPFLSGLTKIPWDKISKA
jgi:peptide/nickel transport system substrate-binding protein